MQRGDVTEASLEGKISDVKKGVEKEDVGAESDNSKNSRCVCAIFLS
jgi:hypothetical protein